MPATSTKHAPKDAIEQHRFVQFSLPSPVSRFGFPRLSRLGLLARCYGVWSMRCHGAAFGFSGSGVKSSPGLMKRSASNWYCLSYSCR